MGQFLAQAAISAGSSLIANALTPKPATPKPPAPIATATREEDAAAAARDTRRRNAMRRGVLSTVKNLGGMAGDLSRPLLIQPALLGKRLGQ